MKQTYCSSHIMVTDGILLMTPYKGLLFRFFGIMEDRTLRFSFSDFIKPVCYAFDKYKILIIGLSFALAVVWAALQGPCQPGFEFFGFQTVRISKESFINPIKA